MLAFLVGHLWFVAPGAQLLRWDGMLDGVSKTAVVVTGYQYSHLAALVPVPPEMYNERYIAPPPLRIEAEDGEVLATVEYHPVARRGRDPHAREAAA